MRPDPKSDSLTYPDTLDPDDAQLLANMARLRAMEVYDVMIPRADIVFLDSSDSLAKVSQKVRQYPHSRYPVYRKTPDEVIGFLQVKTLFNTITKAKRQEDPPVELETLVEQPIYAVRSRMVLDLLEHMRRDKIYTALVVDEYGGIEGLVSIKDILDVVVNCFQEDSAQSSHLMLEDADKGLVVDARLPLEELENKLEMTLLNNADERDEVDTVGGYVFLIAGRVPGRGEIIPVDERLEFTVLDADARRIKRLQVVAR